jgi:hypothetical protein
MTNVSHKARKPSDCQVRPGTINAYERLRALSRHGKNDLVRVEGPQYEGDGAC